MTTLPINQIICGDNVATMQTFPDDCIDLVVTSPPYDNLRTYGGHSWDFEGVAQQLWRIIKPGGVVIWVVADATVDGSETGTSFRQALRFKEIGFRLHDTMIYKKAGSSPNIHHPRYSHCFEFMFVLTKGAPFVFHPHKKRKNSTAGVLRRPATKMQRNGKLRSFNVPTVETPQESVECNIWEYLVGGAACCEGVGGHPAYFPEALARDHILSWSNEGDIVLDPFSGSGTTAKMAKHNGRQWIGIEVNPEYCEIAEKRLAQGVLF
jgi:site-specific DNA-methyltransferase (adenine-specific)